MLAIDGIVASNLGVTPRIELEVNDVDQAIVENGGEFIDDEIGTVWAQALIVQIQGHLFFCGIRTLRDEGDHKDHPPEEREIAAMIMIRSHEQVRDRGRERGGEEECGERKAGLIIDLLSFLVKLIRYKYNILYYTRIIST